MSNPTYTEQRMESVNGIAFMRLIPHEMRCDACRFFDPGAVVRWKLPEELGWCKRSSPQGTPTENGHLMGQWPVVAPLAWCGEFQPR